MNEQSTSELERYEAMAGLYYRRFSRLAPGKSESSAMGSDSNSEENMKQFSEWISSGLALHDSMHEVARLAKDLEGFDEIEYGWCGSCDRPTVLEVPTFQNENIVRKKDVFK